eukprot:Skav219313  [mRNA]  locus=scaffold1152:120684:121398:- [translate_table: standard]
MQSTSTWRIEHRDFLDIISPSFTGVEDSEDMAAILARTHIILLSDNAVYYRVASVEKGKVDCLPWPAPEVKDILAPEYKPIFKAYKANPEQHSLPDGYHADMVWSQELLRKLLAGERIPRTMTIRCHGLFSANVQEIQEAPRLLPPAELVSQGLNMDEDNDHFPAPGEPDDLQLALENLMDEDDEPTS